jgi:hypothetical protein
MGSNRGENVEMRQRDNEEEEETERERVRRGKDKRTKSRGKSKMIIFTRENCKLQRNWRNIDSNLECKELTREEQQ